MAAYLSKVQQTIAHFNTVKVEQIGHNLNSHIDVLATLASVLSTDIKRYILIETLAALSITLHACHVHSIMVDPC